MNTMNTANNWRSVIRFLTSPLGVLAVVLAGALLLAGPLAPARAAAPGAAPAPAQENRTGSLSVSGAAAIKVQPDTATFPAPVQENRSGSLSVSGAAAIKVQPDTATIHVGVETFATTPGESKRLNSVLIRTILNRVTAAGVDEKDVQTDHYIIYPKFRDYSEHNISGYDTYNSVVITVRDVTRFEDVLVGALEGGATQVFGVEFAVNPDRLADLRKRARDMAVEAARDKADRLAQAAGVEVDYVTNVNEDVSAYYSYSGWGRWGYWGQSNMGQYQNVMQVESGGVGNMDDSSISLGQVVVRAKVNMTVKTR